MAKSSALLDPLDAGRLHTRNRVAVTCHGFSPRAYDLGQDKYFAYLERRAAGGAGLIITQAINAQPVGASRPFRYDSLAPALERLAARLHARGTVALVQILNVGAKYRSGRNWGADWTGEPLWGFSAVPSDQAGEVAHEMSGAEVEEMVEGYSRIAALVRAAGFDGVELHGAHGYQLQQSASPWMNRRSDEWGRPLAFWTAVLDRVRDAVGPDGIIGARIASDDLRPVEAGGLGPARLAEIAVDLAATGHVDYFNPTHGSEGVHYSRVVGTYRRPHGEFLAGARQIREAVGACVPVLGVGRIVAVATAEAALARGDCDLVGMTRAHIADPDIVAKTLAGTAAAIRPCVGANTGCIDRGVLGGDMMCFHNPDVGREARPDLLPQPVTAPRRVLVVGGGPAGLKAAETAARRGHRVTLAERSAALGGRLARIDRSSPAHELTSALTWLEHELARLGVDVRTGVAIDQAGLAGYDAVILATGSTPRPVPFPTDGSIPVLSTEQGTAPGIADVLAAPPRAVMVVDQLGTDEAAVVIEQLAAAGTAVTVAAAGTLGAFMGYTHLVDHIPRLFGLGCTLEERVEVLGIAGGMVRTRGRLGGPDRVRTFDAVVLAAPRVAEVSLVRAARRAGVEVQLAGDCESPRDALFAFLTGNDAGRRV
jgi:2,4-dienoyl-CoA reductase-like NADH-dependent reductase (Old Yellow Enzyme family)